MGYGCQHMRYGDEKEEEQPKLTSLLSSQNMEWICTPSDHEVS